MPEADVVARAVTWNKGRLLEAFEVGQCFEHRWGRTLQAADQTLFCALTVQLAPLYFDAEYARSLGHPESPLHPLLVFNTVLGLSVEDLSEAGGPFLGIEQLRWLQPVYAGDTLRARSQTLQVRTSRSRPDAGVVTWRTVGVNQRGEPVVEFERTNLIRKQRTGVEP